ncbi:MAG: haloacid dehalogenase-like hydrolase [Solobacterium sp.]|nr:haloacid dehalogenase-like hydrolase [Solobacterium sp.]
MKKAAVLYDFDKTLCDKDMQEYSLIPSLGYEDAGEFWKEVIALTKGNRMDSISAYLYLLQKKYAESGKPLRREDFEGLGEKIRLYDGVTDWFGRINEYGRLNGLEMEHYVISSGMGEIIERTPIAKEFTRIYACRYYYNENGIAEWPAMIVNYTTKTQYIFRINKQVLDVNDDEDLNAWIPHNERPIPFERMIYIADGITDVPCMRLVKEYGGKSIAVYHPQKDKAKNTAQRLIKEGRVDFMSAADYREGSDLERIVKRILDHMGSDARMKEMEGLR